jgi:hypothetical protein
VCLSAVVPTSRRTGHPFAASSSEELLQKIEFVFSASPEQTERGSEATFVTQPVICRTWQPAHRMILLIFLLRNVFTLRLCLPTPRPARSPTSSVPPHASRPPSSWHGQSGPRLDFPRWISFSRARTSSWEYWNTPGIVLNRHECECLDRVSLERTVLFPGYLLACPFVLLGSLRFIGSVLRTSIRPLGPGRVIRSPVLSGGRVAYQIQDRTRCPCSPNDPGLLSCVDRLGSRPVAGY